MITKNNQQISSKKSTKRDRLYTQSEIDVFLDNDQISKEDYTFFKQLAATEIIEK